MNENLLITKKERKKILKLFREFLPTVGVTYEEYIASDPLTRKAIDEMFRSWLRRRTNEEN